MKHYILIYVVAALIFSCGEPYSEEEEELKSFAFSYDLDKKVNNIELINLHTLIKEGDNTFSRINETNAHGFGIQFSTELISELLGNYASISARIRKSDIHSNLSLVVSSDDANGNLFWKDIKIDSTYTLEDNQWVNFNYSGFNIPEELKDDSVMKIYFWSIDGKQVDIDDFKFEIIEEEEEEYL